MLYKSILLFPAAFNVRLDISYGGSDMAKPSGKQNKLAPVSFRLDPKVKFAAEIMARHQRRSLASTVEWALLRSMEGTVQVGAGQGAGLTLNELVNTSWNEDDFIRAVNVAFLVPHLATHEEACIRTVILSSPTLFIRKRVESVTERDRVNFDTLLLMRDLVKQRAEHLAAYGELIPITDAEWEQAYKDKAGNWPEALEEIEAATKDDDPESLRLKLLNASEYIALLQAQVRMLETIKEQSERETAWNKLNSK